MIFVTEELKHWVLFVRMLFRNQLYVLIQVGPPDDEHLLLETCRDVETNKLRKSASSWSLTRIIS